MKRAIGLIAATLLSTSVYSQDYSSSSSQNSDSTPPDYQSRQTEAGAPATSDSSSSSSSGYEVSPGTTGGNSLTGQSSGANVQGDQGEDKALTTRDSDVSGSEYRGTTESDSETLKGTGTADGAFHKPAAPVREGSQSEGWSGSGTFSGAGPGSVSGSASSSANNIDVDVSTDSSSVDSSSPSTLENSTSFNAEVSDNEALQNRDQSLSDRDLEPDSNALSREDTFDRIDRDINDDGVVIFEDWTIVEPDTNVGGPAGSDSGSSSSSDADNRDQFDSSASGSTGSISSDSGSSYNDELYQQVQRDWSARTGNTDVPATPGVMDHEMDQLRLYNSRTAESLNSGAPASGESGKSSNEKECDVNKGSSAEFEQGELDNSVTSDYHINRGEDESYHINRSKSDSAQSNAPGEYGDRATSENFDDGHLSGNNAAGNSATSESGSSTSSDSNSSTSEEGALSQPDL